MRGGSKEKGISKVTGSAVNTFPLSPPHTHSFTGIALTNCVRTARDTYRVSIMKWVTGALRGCWEWAQDKFTERDVKLINKGRSGGSGTSERDREKEWDKDRQTVRGRVISEMLMEIMTRKGNVQKEWEGKQNKKQKHCVLRICVYTYVPWYTLSHTDTRIWKWNQQSGRKPDKSIMFHSFH